MAASKLAAVSLRLQSVSEEDLDKLNHHNNSQMAFIYLHTTQDKPRGQFTLYGIPANLKKCNLPTQFLMRAHGGFSRVVFLEHTVKRKIPTSVPILTETVPLSIL